MKQSDWQLQQKVNKLLVQYKIDKNGMKMWRLVRKIF